jgi:hypothetical protein
MKEILKKGNKKDMKYSYTAGIKTHKRRGEGSIKMSVI